MMMNNQVICYFIKQAKFYLILTFIFYELGEQTCADKKRADLALQCRLDGDTAFQLKKYQRAVGFYTQSIKIDSNRTAYMNRAKACRLK